MKKYQFPLEKVLMLKTLELDQLVLQLNQVRYEIHQNEQLKKDLFTQHVNLNLDLNSQLKTSLSSYAFNQIKYKIENLKYQIERVKKNLMELKINESIVLERVIDKKKEQSGLKKLDEKLYKEYLESARKKESLLLDEMLILKINQES